jgi:hypothetical protein
MRLPTQHWVVFDVYWMVSPNAIIAYNHKPDAELTAIILSLAETKCRI